MKIYPILNKPGKGKYVFIFILNERAVYVLCVVYCVWCIVCGVLWVLVGGRWWQVVAGGRGKDFVWMWCGI